MMNWIAFFDRYGIDWRPGSRDYAEIHCVWCGAEDPSYHLAVNLKGLGYHCWRNHDHRGRNPARLVQVLLHCSWEEAARIAGTRRLSPVDNLLNRVKELISPTPPTTPASIELLPQFKALSPLPSARPYVQYLKRRDFTDPIQLSNKFNLLYCTQGPFKGRIIFPVTFQSNLVSWTGRTIYPSVELRYKSLSYDVEKARTQDLPAAIGPISNYLLFYDDLVKSKAGTIILCEGPFDALRVRVLGEQHGITATCFFTSHPSQSQVNLLHELLPKFNRRVLLLDQGTTALGLRIKDQLSALDVKLGYLPPGTKDPGTIRTAKDLLRISSL